MPEMVKGMVSPSTELYDTADYAQVDNITSFQSMNLISRLHKDVAVIASLTLRTLV